MAKLHLEMAQGNAGVKLGLIQRGPFHGQHWDVPDWAALAAYRHKEKGQAS